MSHKCSSSKCALRNSCAVNGNAVDNLALCIQCPLDRKRKSGGRMLYGQRLTLLFTLLPVNVSCPLPCPEAS